MSVERIISVGLLGWLVVGIVLMGLKFDTVVGEAFDAWHDASIEPIPQAS